MAKVSKYIIRILPIIFVCLLIIGIVQYLRPIPQIKPVVTYQPPITNTLAVALPWPSYGQSAIGAQDYGVLETHGQQKAAPIASVTKVMTALAVLKKHPLNVGEQGPNITITDTDVTSYNDYVAKGGSVARVATGEQISEYQALQAMLLPSANNIADTLANWSFGSLDKHIEYTNNLTESMGLKDTHIADASGFSPQSMSSAHDLVLIGEAALKNPVLASIVSQKQANVPVAGLIKNTNWLLGNDGVVGIKTGNTGEAGGCYLFAAMHNIGSREVTVIGAILGAPQLDSAINDSKGLISASSAGFKTINIVNAGQSVGYYQIPWGGKVNAVTKSDLSLHYWQGQKVKVNTNLNNVLSPANKDKIVGSTTAVTSQKSINTKVVLKEKIPAPSLRWRIFNR